MCKTKILTNTCSFKNTKEERLLYEFSKSDYISFSNFVKNCLRKSIDFDEFKKEYLKNNPDYFENE